MHQNVGTPQKSDATALKLTEVVPFTLRTDAIHRAPTVKSTAELEEEEIKKGSQFKARKFSSKIANSCGDLGVPKTVPKPVTQTQVCRVVGREAAMLEWPLALRLP